MRRVFPAETEEAVRRVLLQNTLFVRSGMAWHGMAWHGMAAVTQSFGVCLVLLCSSECGFVGVWLFRRTPCASCSKAHRRCTYTLLLPGSLVSDNGDATASASPKSRATALEAEASTASEILDRLLVYHASSAAASPPAEPPETNNDLECQWAALRSHVRGMDSDDTELPPAPKELPDNE